MDTVVLIACSSSKLGRSTPARELYTSTLFRWSLAYAEALQPTAIYVLSAKHGLVELDQVLEPYNVGLRVLSPRARESWGLRVLGELARRHNLQEAHVVVLAGALYREPLAGLLYAAPLRGLGYGEQVAWLIHETSVIQNLKSKST